MSAPVDPSSPSTAANRALGAAATGLPGPLFAVLDGVQYPGLSTEIEPYGLVARPLFLEAGDAQAVASGPFLVALAEPPDLERLLDFCAGRRAPVLWSWPAGEGSLYRHLRTINLAEIPNDRQEDGDQPAYGTVIFRHWDGIVLGQALPTLRAGQIARLLGNATGLAYDADLSGGVQVRTKPADLPPAETGMLRFSPEQVAAMDRARIDRSRLKVARYLDEVDPEGLAELDAQGRLARVADYERSGNAFGLQSERAHMKWAYIMSVTGGEAAILPEVTRILQNTEVDPEQSLDVILDRFDEAWSAAERG